MSHSSFEHLRTESIPSLNLQFEEYRHRVTGARHLHLAADDNNNVFLIGFLTVPEDSSGVAHILEHTSLCGSERFPVRDPFFMMTRRSLNTFMNAFTSSDWTAYPFASQNRKDFYNLMQVYLDATFFPNLNPLDFAQEGHRLEFEESENPESPLIYKGIVYNEMKGALSSPVQFLWQKFSEILFPTTTYHYNSGGEPEDIVKLSWEQLKTFHATHYHPSNAVFMTYGDLPAEKHQAYFQEHALARFDKPGKRLHIVDEKRYTQPLAQEVVYSLDEADLSHKTHIVLGWLLGHSSDPLEAMKARLLSGILFDNSASPLTLALETTDLGMAPSPLCGVDSQSREMIFVAGLENSDPEHAQAVESLILDTLKKVAEEGVSQDVLESVLHRLELQQREISGGRMPYGLQLILQTLSPVLYDSDPVAALNIDPQLAQLREMILQPDFIKNLIQEWLLDNTHRVRLVMKPDAQLHQRQLDAEKAQLQAIKKQLDADKTQKIIEQSKALQARQLAKSDPEILPKVALKDVPDEMLIAEGQQRRVQKMPVSWYAQGTNGMVYQHLIAELPALDDSLLNLFPFYTDCLNEVGVGQRDYLQTQAWQSAVSGGISAGYSSRIDVHDIQRFSSFFTFSGKALRRNQDKLVNLLHDSFTQPRFDELGRLRELVNQIRTSVEHSMVSRAGALVMDAASNGFTPMSALSSQWGGLESIIYLKKLDDALQDPEQLQIFAGQLQAIHEAVVQQPQQLLVISEADAQQEIEQALNSHWSSANHQAMPNQESLAQRLQQSFTTKTTRQGWIISSQVSFNAKAYPAVYYHHADAPALMILGEFLNNGYLHHAIREQGGAYGTSAGYNPSSGLFRFSSHRDPHMVESFAHFDQALEWLQSDQHETRLLEEAILSVISRIDRPGSPAGEAQGAFFSLLYGRDPDSRRQFRHQLLNVTLADLQRVASTWLKPEQANIAVISNKEKLEKYAPALELNLMTL
ncbi:insulinase family protein [Candidatus Venteria ishoeyi]|uniref:insulinase family protein n=1 Tax=Candidatus Venteria ishoeyi TaxID=1899563 RepID=UPI0025A575A5|nr:insulinase family protein [Candidatus Venteria ishoeyi]MDM8548002.1 insulinase family protein [Candidatus Venteria ishoeyi]